jgi:hypothetical protein
MLLSLDNPTAEYLTSLRRVVKLLGPKSLVGQQIVKLLAFEPIEFDLKPTLDHTVSLLTCYRGYTATALKVEFLEDALPRVGCRP